MKRIKFLFIALFVVLLSGCGEGTVKIFTYFSDLINVASRKANIAYINASLVIQNLEKEEDINYLRENLNSFSNEKVTGEYTKSCSFDIKIPIVNQTYLQRYLSSNESSKDFFYIIASSSGGNSYQFSYHYNENSVKKIDQYIYSKHSQRINLAEFDITISVENDMSANMTLMAFSVYVNEIAYPSEYMKTMQRRDKIELHISEVLRKSIANNNVHEIFYIY